jgi:hypothetical protein
VNAVTVTLDQNDLAVIAAGLGELPLKVSKATFDKINAQVAAAAAATADESTSPDYSAGGTD